MERVLSAAGISDAEALALGEVGAHNGYGLAIDAPLSLKTNREMALTFIWLCADIRKGRTTWSASIGDDVASGATSKQAREMNRYVKAQFCPSVRPNRGSYEPRFD